MNSVRFRNTASYATVWIADQRATLSVDGGIHEVEQQNIIQRHYFQIKGVWLTMPGGFRIFGQRFLRLLFREENLPQ